MTSLQILVVEDDPNMRAALVVALAVAGWEVVAVGALAEAVLRVEDVDVVLLDLGLPDASGLRAVERLQPAGVPIVVLTGDDSRETLEDAMLAGADDVLHKPSPMRPIVDALHKALYRRRVCVPVVTRAIARGFQEWRPAIAG